VILVQDCLTNHPDIARFSSGPLCTFRVVTYLDDEGVPALLGLILKFARAGSEVDNFHAGGIICAVDPGSGRLGPAISGDPAEPPPDIDSDVIDGATLTAHRAVIALALSAHKELQVPWNVGWDIAMTPEGPTLVEGNPAWAVDLYHASHPTGLPPEFANGFARALSRRGA
jgi:hypothetical protein